MGDVTDLDPGRGRTGRPKRKARRARHRAGPLAGSPVDLGAAEASQRAGYCTTCQAGLHARCTDYLDFAFGAAPAEKRCGCGCFTGTEIRPGAVWDMAQRQPEYAVRWLRVQQRIQGHVHVCGRANRPLL